MMEETRVNYPIAEQIPTDVLAGETETLKTLQNKPLLRRFWGHLKLGGLVDSHG